MALATPDGRLRRTDTIDRRFPHPGQAVSCSPDRRFHRIGIIKARLFLAMKEDEKVRAGSRLIADMLSVEEAIYESMDDIRDFCHILTDAGYLEEAGWLIDVATARMEGIDVTHVLLRLTEMKVDYYEKVRDENRLMKSLTELNRLFLQSEKERQELYHYSIEYIGLIDELKEEEEEIRRENEVLLEQAEEDALCKIPNRYAMDRELENAFERAYAAQKTLGVGLLDVNRFKEINDIYGHQAGDQYLVMIGLELKKLAKDPRIFCSRYGGDEFLIIYEGMTEDEILRKADALRSAIAKRKIRLKGGMTGTSISVSQGICNAVPHEQTRLWDYLTVADAGLYEVKRTDKTSTGVCLCGLPGRYR